MFNVLLAFFWAFRKNWSTFFFEIFQIFFEKSYFQVCIEIWEKRHCNPSKCNKVYCKKFWPCFETKPRRRKIFKLEIMKNGQKSSVNLTATKIQSLIKKRLLQILVCLLHVLFQLLNKFRYMVSKEIYFEISRNDLLLRLCDDWCSHQNLSLTFDFTR